MQAPPKILAATCNRLDHTAKVFPNMSDFQSYRRRAERMKLLEEVLERAKDVFAASAVHGKTENVWLALAKLREAVARCDELPPVGED